MRPHRGYPVAAEERSRLKTHPAFPVLYPPAMRLLGLVFPLLLAPLLLAHCTEHVASEACPSLTADAATRPAGVSFFGGQDSGADWASGQSIPFTPAPGGTGSITTSIRFVTTDDVAGLRCLSVHIEARSVSGESLGVLDTMAVPDHRGTGVYTIAGLTVPLRGASGTSVILRAAAAGGGYSGSAQAMVTLR